jgi:hypothetical protein
MDIWVYIVYIDIYFSSQVTFLDNNLVATELRFPAFNFVSELCGLTAVL